MKELSITHQIGKLLLVLFLSGIIGFGTIHYATKLKEDIKRKKEIQNLEKEKLQLEIKILKKYDDAR